MAESLPSRRPRGPAIEETALLVALAGDPSLAMAALAGEMEAEWGMVPQLPGYEYDAIGGEYRKGDERLTEEALVALLLLWIQSKRRGAASVFETLRDGRISLAELQVLVERDMALTTLVGAAVAAGGPMHLSPAHYATAGAMLLPEATKWTAYVKGIAAGASALDGTVANAIRGVLTVAALTFHPFRTVEMEKMGFNEYRNRLNDGLRHCRAHDGRPSCAAVTDKGWRRIGTLTRQGGRGCYDHCGCWWEYRNTLTGKVRR